MTIPGLAEMMAKQLGQSITPFSSTVHPADAGCKRVLKELKFLHRMNPRAQDQGTTKFIPLGPFNSDAIIQPAGPVCIRYNG
jgi:hypothetical protein